MTKVKNQNQNFKISVDEYMELESGQIICLCYTPGLTDAEEPKHINKDVKIEDLKAWVADNKGKIDITTCWNPDNEMIVPFEYWWCELCDVHDKCNVLADYINAKEGRKEMADMPDITASINKIMAHFSPLKSNAA